MTNVAIDTDRLELILLSGEILEYLRNGDLDSAAEALSVRFPHEFLLSLNVQFLALQIDRVRSHPASPGWTVRLIVRKTDRRVVGHCGFHGVPLDVGRAEIGYTVLPEHRRRGYATESARGLVQWARLQGSREVFATISPDNEFSLNVVRRLGFRQIGVELDKVDGPESVFRLVV